MDGKQTAGPLSALVKNNLQLPLDRVEAQQAGQILLLAAGDLLIYPSTNLHQVCPVTSGARLCAFFWLQSMVRDAEQRWLLFELDQGVQQLSRGLGNGHASVLQLSGVYHNLVRQWAGI